MLVLYRIMMVLQLFVAAMLAIMAVLILLYSNDVRIVDYAFVRWLAHSYAMVVWGFLGLATIEFVRLCAIEADP